MLLIMKKRVTGSAIAGSVIFHHMLGNIAHFLY